MPNWCDNSMRLSNQDKTKIDALEAVLQEKNAEGFHNGQVFQHLRPNPSGEWEYDWSINNWGTKWDADVFDWERCDDHEIVIYANTAWSPPIALYEYLYEEGWEVEALYHESGMCFAGMWINGDDEYYEYDITSKSSIEDLPTDIVDFAGLEDAHENWLEEQREDYIRELPTTEWFEGSVKPVREGRYEVRMNGRDWSTFIEWNGNDWGTDWEDKPIVPDVWRGLASEFTDADYQKMLDTIAESN